MASSSKMSVKSQNKLNVEEERGSESSDFEEEGEEEEEEDPDATFSSSDDTDDGSSEFPVTEKDFHPDILWHLPAEVWTLIFRYIPQSDRIHRLRLVCKPFLDLVNQCSTFKISYSAVHSQLRESVFSLRIRGCEFGGLKDTLEEPFLSHPLSVKEITLGACVAPSNTMRILTACCNVEHLRIFVTEKSDTAFDPDAVDINYPAVLNSLHHLKSIELGIMFFGSKRTPSDISSSVKTLFGNKGIVFPSISEIQINYKLTRSEWDLLSQFVSQHSKTLTRLRIYEQCFCDYKQADDEEDPGGGGGAEEANANNPPPPPELDLDVFSNCKWKSVEISRGTGGRCNCPTGQTFWTRVFANRKSQLEHLTSDLLSNKEVMEDVIRANVSTLTSLTLQNISLGLDAFISFSIFENCHNLQSLSLSFMSSAVVVVTLKDMVAFHRASNEKDEKSVTENKITHRYSECSELDLLPKSLVKLSIKGCDLHTDELLRLSKKLKQLRELCLGEPGGGKLSRTRGKSVGVTMDVLVSILEDMEDLQYLSLDRDVVNFDPKAQARADNHCEEWADQFRVLGRMFQHCGPTLCPPKATTTTTTQAPCSSSSLGRFGQVQNKDEAFINVRLNTWTRPKVMKLVKLLKEELEEFE